MLPLNSVTAAPKGFPCTPQMQVGFPIFPDEHLKGGVGRTERALTMAQIQAMRSVPFLQNSQLDLPYEEKRRHVFTGQTGGINILFT